MVTWCDFAPFLFAEEIAYKKCPGMYCGRTVYADGNRSDCGVRKQLFIATHVRSTTGSYVLTGVCPPPPPCRTEQEVPPPRERSRGFALSNLLGWLLPIARSKTLHSDWTLVTNGYWWQNLFWRKTAPWFDFCVRASTRFIALKPLSAILKCSITAST